MADSSRKRLAPEKRHAQLLDCAVIVAARLGLGRLVHAEVARECGVSVATVFAYFPNRSALVNAVVEAVKAFYIEQGEGWHQSQIPAHEALLGHVRAFADSVEQYPQHAQVWLEWSTAVRNEGGIWDSFLDYQERMVKMVAASIRRGQRQGAVLKSINAIDAARLFVASAYTVTQMRFMRRNRRAINRFIDQTIHLALHDLPSGNARRARR